MSEEIFESQKDAYQNDKHTFQFIARVECCNGTDEQWITKYDDKGFETVTQKNLFNKYKDKVKEFYVFPKGKTVSVDDQKQISIPHPYVGINLRNGDIVLNDMPLTFQEDFDDELKDLDLIFYWTNLLSSHVTYKEDGSVYGQRDHITPKLYHIGWKNEKGLRIVKIDLDTGKFSIRTTKR